MGRILLLTEGSGQSELKNAFSEMSYIFDAVYDVSQIPEIPRLYSDALVFVRVSPKPEIILEMLRVFHNTGIRTVFVADENDNGIRAHFKNNPFAYINYPLVYREIELVLFYHNHASENQYILKGPDLSQRDTFPDNNTGKHIYDGEERYHKLLGSIPMIAVQGYNRNREVIFWNTASENLYGFSSQEAIGNRIETLIIPDELKDVVAKEISGYFEHDKEIEAAELSLLRKDGKRVHVFSSHVIFKNSRGEKELFSIDIDLTQIKRHQLIQEMLSEIVSATNSSNDLQDFFQLLRNSLSRIINTQNFFAALYNEEDNSFSLPIFIDEVDKFRTFPAGRTLTAYMISKNKPLLLTEKDITSLEDNDLIDRVGTPCKMWLGIPLRSGNKVKGALVFQSYTDETIYDETDIRTLQIVAEQISIAIERKARQEQLKESERAIKTLISNLPGIAYRCRFDKSWSMEFLSDGFTILTGYEVDDFINNEKMAFSGIIHPDDRADVWEQVIEVLSDKEPYYLVYRIIANGGIIKWVWEKGRGVFDENDNLVALEGFIIDITDRIEMEEQIIGAKEQAEESDRLKSAFLANLSHEIRSPMNSIIGFSQLMKMEQVQEPVNQYVDIILRSSQQLLNVINDIVDMAKIDSGQMVVKKETIDFQRLMNGFESYADEKLVQFENKTIEIRMIPEVHADNVSIISDETLIHQTMVHLINNALKFTNNGHIEIGYMINNTSAIFFVKDTGIGVSPEHQVLIFERFRQVDERITRNFDGTGLGLAIAKGISVLLGGDIRIVSSAGTGSEFYFTIPVL